MLNLRPAHLFGVHAARGLCPICTQRSRCSSSATASSTSTTPVLPPGTIDGSKTPDLIPDIVAYRLVFVAFSEPPNPTAEQASRQHAKLGSLELSKPDIDIFSSELSRFHDRYRQLIAGQTPNTPATDDARGAFIQARDAIVSDTVAALESRGSANAIIRFKAFVLSEKKHMTMAPVPKMSN